MSELRRRVGTLPVARRAHYTGRVDSLAEKLDPPEPPSFLGGVPKRRELPKVQQRRQLLGDQAPVMREGRESEQLSEELGKLATELKKTVKEEREAVEKSRGAADKAAEAAERSAAAVKGAGRRAARALHARKGSLTFHLLAVVGAMCLFSFALLLVRISPKRA